MRRGVCYFVLSYCCFIDNKSTLKFVKNHKLITRTRFKLTNDWFALGAAIHTPLIVLQRGKFKQLLVFRFFFSVLDIFYLGKFHTGHVYFELQSKTVEFFFVGEDHNPDPNPNPFSEWNLPVWNWPGWNISVTLFLVSCVDVNRMQSTGRAGNEWGSSDGRVDAFDEGFKRGRGGTRSNLEGISEQQW